MNNFFEIADFVSDTAALHAARPVLRCAALEVLAMSRDIAALEDRLRPWERGPALPRGLRRIQINRAADLNFTAGILAEVVQRMLDEPDIDGGAIGRRLLEIRADADDAAAFLLETSARRSRRNTFSLRPSVWSRSVRLRKMGRRVGRVAGF